MKTNPLLLLVVVVVCGLVIAGMVYAFSSGIPVETAPVTRGEIRQFVDERAVTRLPQTHRITMPFAGRLDSIVQQNEDGSKKELKDWKEGDPIRQGDILARIVPRDLDLAVQQATATVERLEASITKSNDVTVEETAFEQAGHFVDSMEDAVKAALARVEAGKAKYDYAETDFGRVDRLVKSGALTQDDLDRATLRRVESRVKYQEDYLVHAATVAMKAATDLMPIMVRQHIFRKQTRDKDVLVKEKAEAQARLDQVLQDRDRGTMRSQFDGVLLKRYVTNEGFLPAGELLFEIGRLDELQIEADVLSLDVADTTPGDKVEIYGPAVGRDPAAGKDRAVGKDPVFGEVHRIDPAGFTKVSSLGVEQQRVKVIIRFDDLALLLKERHLGVGYRVRVQITTAEKPDALTVPRSALFRGADGQWQVYVIRNGRAQIQDVKVGLINDEQVEITSGLKEDEQVVLAPESNLTGGARVTTKKAKGSKQPPPAE